ncbi:MAG: transcriptional regulator [Deltaproteobacteria bacterium]|nr:transcriptional regulator [Deltaproteobacteria bacterium]
MPKNYERLILAKCQNCGQIYVPPIYMCTVCGNKEPLEMTASGEGKMLSYTTIRVPPLGFIDQAPYEIAVIRLKEGINLTGRLADLNGRNIEIGDSVSYLRKDDQGAYWFKLVK